MEFKFSEPVSNDLWLVQLLAGATVAGLSFLYLQGGPVADTLAMMYGL